MNTATNQTDPKGVQLRQTLEHLTLQRMIDQVDKEDLNIKQLCNLLHTCCGHKKAEAAEEKTRSTERIAIQRLNKTHPSPPSVPLRTNSLSPRLCRGADPQPTPPKNDQSHADFCRTLADAAMDIWGVDISAVCKTNRPNDEKTDPSATKDLYDIPPEYRQGATPIKGSQEKYGQPKYTHKEWRKVMFRAIRANYGIHDDPLPSPPNQPRPHPLASKRPPQNQLPQPPALPGVRAPTTRARKNNSTPRLSNQAPPRAPP